MNPHNLKLDRVRVAPNFPMGILFIFLIPSNLAGTTRPSIAHGTCVSQLPQISLAHHPVVFTSDCCCSWPCLWMFITRRILHFTPASNGAFMLWPRQDASGLCFASPLDQTYILLTRQKGIMVCCFAHSIWAMFHIISVYICVRVRRISVRVLTFHFTARC